jgi:hypothetical protein
MFATPMRRRIGNRAVVVAAGVAGFALGAAGFAAASHDSGELERAASSSSSSSSTAVSTTVDDDDDDDATSTSVATTVDDDDDVTTSTSVANTVDATSTSIGDDDDDNTSTSVANTIDDDDTSTSSSTTNAPAAPAPFTQSYSSAGGSITVTWNGSSLSLDAISPAPGFAAEIEDAGGSRVRVDFEGNGGSGGDDARIEVRIEDGRFEVRVD